MNKKRIGVIMGGISSERDISLKTGEEIIINMDHDKYEPVPITVNKKEDVINNLGKIDLAFIALHGKFGEDGTVQSVLQTLSIPYTGCGPLTSAACMDKDISKKILMGADVLVAPYFMVNKDNKQNALKEAEKIGYPVVVKPNSGGSSVATNIVKSGEKLIENINKALEYDREVMVEKYIKGDEITCCILNGEVLPTIAIKPRSEFFDYTSKYADGGSDEIIVTLNEDLQKKVNSIAKTCYDTFKCSVYSRVDMIVKDGEPYVLELNTLPGMTKNSLFPKAAKEVNISFKELINRIIELSLEIDR